MSGAAQPPTPNEAIADKIESALNGALEFLGRVFFTLWTVCGRLIRARTTRQIPELATLVSPLPLLLLCSFPYVLLQWAVVDVWYDRYASELARPFLTSLMSSVEFGKSISAAIVLTLPVVALVIAARAVLARLLRVEQAERVAFQAAITDGFALQFILAAATHVFCFGAAVVASVAQYLWPTGLLGEPKPTNEWNLEWLPFVWMLGAMISALVPPVAAITALKTAGTTQRGLQKVTRLVIVLMVCGATSVFSLYFVYIAQLMYKGTDLFERRAVTTTCRQVVVRVADNLANVRLPVETSRGTNTPGAAPVVELTLLVNNGSDRTLIFSRRLGRVTSLHLANALTDDSAPIIALYLKPAEAILIRPGEVSAIPVAVTLQSPVPTEVDGVQSKFRDAVLEYSFSFVGQPEEFRYHGEWPTSHCSSSFRATKWVVRAAEPVARE